MRRAALLVVALALSGCETTAEKSARLERAAKQHEGFLSRRGLSIARPSTRVRVTGTAVVHSSEGTAAVVTLQNVSSTTLRSIPVEIIVKDARGATIYMNDAPGLGSALVSAPLLPAHRELTWVDDQIQAAGTPASVSAKVGEGVPVSGAVPELAVLGVHIAEAPGSGPAAEGSVANRSRIAQRELVVYGVASRAGRVVAAGRAVIPQAAPSASTRFQLFFIGAPGGGQLRLSAPATSVG